MLLSWWRRPLGRGTGTAHKPSVPGRGGSTARSGQPGARWHGHRPAEPATGPSETMCPLSPALCLTPDGEMISIRDRQVSAGTGPALGQRRVGVWPEVVPVVSDSTAGVDVHRTFQIATVDVVGGGNRPLEWASRLSGQTRNRTPRLSRLKAPGMAASPMRASLQRGQQSERLGDLGKLGRRRKAFERGPDCGLGVGVAPR